MDTRKYQISSEIPQYFGDTDTIQNNLKICTHCQAKLIFQHVPNHEKMILKEVIRCATCESQSIHQLHQIH